MSRKRIILGLAAALLVGTASPALADDMGHKLGRGVANLLTGWLEIPKQIIIQKKETNGWDAATKGFGKGLVHAFARTTVGAYETLTFPIAVPEEYRTIITPEFVNSDWPS